MYSFNSLKDVTRCYRGPQEMITRAPIGPRAALWEPMRSLMLLRCIASMCRQLTKCSRNVRKPGI